MNHYPRHIGDWMRDTAHLSEVEECIYSRLVDQYYSRERPLPTDAVQCCRLVRAITPAARRAVTVVLGEFFTLEADGHHQKRCDVELQAQAERSEKAAKGGRVKASKRLLSKTQAGFEQSDEHTNEQSLSSDQALLPITHNPEPITQRSSTSSGALPKKNGHAVIGSRLLSDWRIPDEWVDWTLEAYPDQDRAKVIRLSLEFRDYWAAVPGAKGRKTDWLATWRNNCRRKFDA